MKKCDEIQEVISAYVDGESNSAETSAMFSISENVRSAGRS